MRILRAKTSKNSSRSLLRQLFPNQGLFAFVLVCVGFALFAGGAIYGGYLNKTTQASTLADMARGLMSQKLQIIPNYLSGLQADPIVLRIDMKNNDYQKLAYLREETIAAKSRATSQEVKDEVVPGKIYLDGSEERMSAGFSLTGQNPDHIGQPQKWSLRVKLKKKKLLFGMGSFTLLVPRTRARPPFTEWLNHRLDQYIGLISLRYDFVKVIVNGKDLGIYALEERFDKRLLERNERREGIIVRITNTTNRSLNFYKEKKIAENPALAEQAKQLETIWAGFWAGDIPASAVFDVDKLASFYAMTDLVNGQHTHVIGNEYFYLSPITRLLEPIGREWNSPYKKPADYRLFVEDLNPAIRKDAEVAPNAALFHGNVFKDEEFTRKYFEYLREFSSTSFLNGFLDAEEKNITAAQRLIYSDTAYYDASPDFLFDKIDYIQSYLGRDFSEGMRAYLQSNDNSEPLTLENDYHFPLRCVGLRIGEQRLSIDVLVQSNGKARTQIPTELIAGNSHSMYIDCQVPGIENIFSVKVFPWQKADAAAMNIYPVADYGTNPAIESDGGALVINAGPLTLNENLVVAKDQSITIKAGAEIDLVDGAFILSYGQLNIEGTETSPVRVGSSDRTGRGIVVLNADGTNTVRHAVFSNLKPAVFPGWFVSAAVLFHETDVVIDHVRFDSNDSEDALNIVRSDFVISNSVFYGNKSDAFDSDFSRGTVKNTEFLNTGNDSIDTSGSRVEIIDIIISGSGDKGISVGEASVMTGTNLMVKESGIAISSKDNSSFEFENVNLEGNALGFALFQKKPEYGPTQGVIRGMAMTGDGDDYLVEAGSSLSIDDNLMVGDIDDVKVLMYGNVYGRKTVR